MNSKQHRKISRQLLRFMKPMADAIDDLAAGVEEGIVSTEELRGIAAELRSSGRAKSCAGRNCATTTGQHSPECIEDHAQACKTGKD